MTDDSLSPREPQRTAPSHAVHGEGPAARASVPEDEAPLPTAGFWDHLDALRRVLLRVLGVTGAAAVAAFACKRWLFAAVLAPARPDFVLWRLLARLSGGAEPGGGLPEAMPQLISTQLTSQLLAHMTAALYAGVLAASPYIVWQLFRFVSPALYRRERRRSAVALVASGCCFFAGTALGYWVIFPFSFRFLSAYQVSEQVVNTITLASYMDTLLLIVLMMGVLFQLPVAAWFCARMGLLSSRAMRERRRHALFAIVALAAVITPTTDVFTLAVVSLPVMALYELSVAIVARAERAAGR